MKKLIIYFFALLPVASIAQVDRSKAPKPSPAPEIKIGQPATFTLANGLKVFVVENSKLPRVTSSLTIDMEGIVEGDKAGLTDMAGTLLRRGTSTLAKAKLDEEIDFLGASINTSATGVTASSLKNNFPRVMSLMSDIVLRPSFPMIELEKIRKQELSGLQAAKDNPDAISQNVVNRLTYGKDHPYGDITTEKTLNNVKLEDIKNYFSTYWKPNNAFLIFVGDITAAEAKVLAEKSFGSWQKGTVPKVTYKVPEAPAKTYIAIVDRPSSVQSLITFVSPVPLKPGSPEAIPASVMNNILGGGSSGRLFTTLREKRGFTYGAYSNLKSDRLIGSFSASASVRNEKTDSAIAEFLSEFKRLGSESLTPEELFSTKNFMSGGFARSLENPATIANFALNIARYNLPVDYYQNYLKNLGSVGPETVQSMATKMVNPNRLHIVIVGNAKEISKGLEKYGEVKYFDVYGNEMTAPTAKKVDASVTPESILRKAITATGGESAIAAIKDVEANGSASIMGQTIEIKQKYILPGAYMSSASVSGIEVQKQLMKNGQYTVMQQGAEQQVGEDDKEELNEKGSFFTEAYLLKQTGYTYTLKGIEQVEGKDAYNISVKSPKGRDYSMFYDVASGMKVKETSVKDAGPMGKLNIQTYYGNYKTFNGVQIPTQVLIDLGQFKQDITFNDIKVNQGLKADDLK